ncbi:hypothetical protein F5148DRAFT_176961 [Russula earlei]|uniref:Uncharacterized protein n=1 Tax=Russula earlei TaxID=71964 RepID=A0ACC0U6W8_9AGAM|nr:hypothetical protein F5148DRAFT_176961 [Russula earlei]
MSTPQPLVRASDILVDGFISHTFSPEDADRFFTLLLRTPNFLRHKNISYSQGVWYIMPNVHSIQPGSLGVPAQTSPLPLDYSVRTTQGTVVPQRRWIPAVEVDFRRHVEGATLQPPIFFLNRNGEIGFWLPDILQGRYRDHLHNGDREAPLGGRSTIHIRINWPGYVNWKRQIPGRDETHARSPIIIARFVKHVGASVDRFFNQCVANDPVAIHRWGIGTHGITQGHVKVIGAVHVSAGSWMPIIQLTGYVL